MLPQDTWGVFLNIDLYYLTTKVYSYYDLHANTISNPGVYTCHFIIKCYLWWFDDVLSYSVSYLIVCFAFRFQLSQFEVLQTTYVSVFTLLLSLNEKQVKEKKYFILFPVCFMHSFSINIFSWYLIQILVSLLCYIHFCSLF